MVRIDGKLPFQNLHKAWTKGTPADEADKICASHPSFSFATLVYKDIDHFCVVGGDEWKVVAQELNQLDNFILHPFDAALASISSLRY